MFGKPQPVADHGLGSAIENAPQTAIIRFAPRQNIQIWKTVALASVAAALNCALPIATVSYAGLLSIRRRKPTSPDWPEMDVVDDNTIDGCVTVFTDRLVPWRFIGTAHLVDGWLYFESDQLDFSLRPSDITYAKRTLDDFGSPEIYGGFELGLAGGTILRFGPRRDVDRAEGLLRTWMASPTPDGRSIYPPSVITTYTFNNPVSPSVKLAISAGFGLTGALQLILGINQVGRHALEAATFVGAQYLWQDTSFRSKVLLFLNRLGWTRSNGPRPEADRT